MKNLKPSLVEIRRTRNREDILQKTAEIAIQKGIEGVSMEEIAERVNLTRATLYTFFDNKYEIISAILQPVLDKAADDISKIEPTEPQRATEELLKLYLELWKFNSLAMKVLYRAQHTVMKQDRNERSGNGFIQHMEQILTAAQKANMLRVNDGALSARMLMAVAVPTLELLERRDDWENAFQKSMKGYLLSV